MGDRTLGRCEVVMVGVGPGGVTLIGLGAAQAMANDQGGEVSGSWLVTRQDDPPDKR